MTELTEHVYAVVMAGGKGTRFWPWSREHRPKQFLPLAGEESMLRQTCTRLQPELPWERILIVTTETLAEGVKELLPELPEANLVLEPEGRNTAPCLALALEVLEARDPQATMVVLSADHWIGDREAFLSDIALAAGHAAEQGSLVTFGIRPAHPETGYGYIETKGEGPVRDVVAFREKPPLEKALEYVATGRHFWNAGMFIWTVGALRRELQAHAPEVLAPLDAWMQAGGQVAALPEAYAKTPKLSIDYALMEKSQRVAVVPASFRWSDVGAWPAVVDFQPKDEAGNAITGTAVLVGSRDCAVFGRDRLVAGAGLEGLIVVDTEDALLVLRRDRAQDVKTVVDRLQAMGRHDLL